MKYLSSIDFASALFSILSKEDYLEIYLTCSLLNKSWYRFCKAHLDGYLINYTKQLDADLSILELPNKKVPHGFSPICKMLGIKFQYGRIENTSMNPYYKYTRESKHTILAKHLSKNRSSVITTLLYKLEDLIYFLAMMVDCDDFVTKRYKLVIDSTGLYMLLDSYLFRSNNNSKDYLYYIGRSDEPKSTEYLALEHTEHLLDILSAVNNNRLEQIGYTKDTWESIKAYHRYIPKVLHPIFD